MIPVAHNHTNNIALHYEFEETKTTRARLKPCRTQSLALAHASVCLAKSAFVLVSVRRLVRIVFFIHKSPRRSSSCHFHSPKPKHSAVHSVHSVLVPSTVPVVLGGIGAEILTRRREWIGRRTKGKENSVQPTRSNQSVSLGAPPQKHTQPHSAKNETEKPPTIVHPTIKPPKHHCHPRRDSDRRSRSAARSVVVVVVVVSAVCPFLRSARTSSNRVAQPGHHHRRRRRRRSLVDTVLFCSVCGCVLRVLRV